MTNAKPGWDSAPALHPAENHRHRTQIFKPAAFGAAGRARSDACRVEFVHRSGLLEVFEYIRIVGNLVAIDAIRLLRYFLNGFFPKLRMLNCFFSAERERFQTGGDHQLEIPL